MPSAFLPFDDQITVTGAANAATLIFDASIAAGFTGFWDLHICNTDADAADVLYIGFSATIDTDDGFPLGIFADGNEAHRIRIQVPPHGKVYANCTAAETRDVRVLATPLA